MYGTYGRGLFRGYFDSLGFIVKVKKETGSMHLSDSSPEDDFVVRL